MKTAFLLVSLFWGKFLAPVSEDIQGVWFNEEKTSKVQIYKQGEKYYGKIVWIKDAGAGAPRLDAKNPEEKLRTRPIVGLVMLTDFTYDGDGVWTGGKIYDPRNGKTYSCKITKVSETELAVRGYIGSPLLGRTTKFWKTN
ncbi:DUF2147 domain-containing protein [Siphonobacter aquaeclarae]|uniref:DUF2147 domain-containing protein n=1 Tax=Siphonobacter aquaeclarae TaxID=563176 RepID=A0A1G9RY29_9BACT|nr:DUF2147 domain-containing protein [Siphonobacter aquaeclarae]SDM28064.1 hypothetical protein SAMN04488090_3096 [Siphonobacter aquaeclarae]